MFRVASRRFLRDEVSALPRNREIAAARSDCVSRSLARSLVVIILYTDGRICIAWEIIAKSREREIKVF